jgi:hypothetical protein
MLTQVAVTYKLIAKALTAVLDGKSFFPSAFALSIYFSNICIGITHPVTSMPSLTLKERTYINNLSQNPSEIPAWLIAQLLDASDRVRRFTASQPVPTTVPLNNLLASPGRYKLKIIAIKATFVEFSDVTRELQLPPPDRCWSVILLDSQYHQPIQVFTTQNPSGFQKDPEILAVGYYLASRIDRPKRGASTQVLIIPVLIGSLLPLELKRPPSTTPFSPFSGQKKIPALFTTVLLMIIIYFAIKVYMSRRYSVQKRFSLRNRGFRDENS